MAQFEVGDVLQQEDGPHHPAQFAKREVQLRIPAKHIAQKPVKKPNTCFRSLGSNLVRSHLSHRGQTQMGISSGESDCPSQRCRIEVFLNSGAAVIEVTAPLILGEGCCQATWQTFQKAFCRTRSTIPDARLSASSLELCYGVPSVA